MASARQIAANRRNAKRSRGPSAQHGTARSSRNALKHGLSARRHLLASESPEEYLGLSEQIRAELKPKGALELELAQQVVSVLWRLRRIPAFEAALMASLREEANKKAGEEAPKLALGSTVRSFLNFDYSGKLSRYQASLHREFSALMKALNELQGRRREEEEAKTQGPQLQ